MVFVLSCAHTPTQISLDTRDVFIECTATDLTKAKVVLNTGVTESARGTHT